MKASELRIGNLLQGNPISNVNQGIYGDGVITITGYGIHMMEIMGLDYKPIPLTEEWLVKFGFKKDDDTCFLHKDMDRTGIYFETGDDWDFERANICGDYDECCHVKVPEYLHQLQNLYFALTGKELTI